MGDLWPRSVLLDPNTGETVLIDWELAHFGRPEQDTAHFLAHLWLHGEVGPATENWKATARGFQAGYASLCGDERLRSHGFRVHFLSECTARLLGPFSL